MKKIIALLLIISCLAFVFTACGDNDGDDNGNNTPQLVKINIGVMNGPTGMGMAKLINDNGMDSAKYAFTTFSSPQDATAGLQNGELDMLCVPTNLAANLANKASGFVTVAAINCLGSLYVVTRDGVEINDISDLQNKTIYYGEATSTTGPILNYILSENDITANLVVEDTMDILSAKIVNGTVDIAVLPEPKATAAILSAKQNSNNYSISLNLSTEWSEVSDTPLTMGCIIVRNEFLAENKASVDAFLAEYKASIEYVGSAENKDAAAQMIVDAGILPKLPVAKSALSNLYGSIVYIDGESMKNALKGFYSAINMTSPADAFYYEK